MANQLAAGSNVFNQTDNAMAAAIEKHMNDFLNPTLPNDDTKEARDRRALFAAIARGVLEHLKSNPEALEVVFTSVDGGTIGNYAAHVQVNASDV
jgi:hypothetical protein